MQDNIQETSGHEEIFEGLDSDDLMTPEDEAMFQALLQKRKQQKEALSGAREKLFTLLCDSYGALISKAKKDVCTVSTKGEYEDGNKWSVTMGIEADKEDEIDGNELTRKILSENLSVFEKFMGSDMSLRISGEHNGTKLFWQVRKLKSA